MEILWIRLLFGLNSVEMCFSFKKKNGKKINKIMIGFNEKRKATEWVGMLYIDDEDCTAFDAVFYVDQWEFDV